MSTDALPITPARFAEAIADLPLSSLHLKVLELRNNIAHLDYSNEQLRPFAEGTQTALFSSSSTTASPEQPDQDCIDAIRENEQVIARMNQRIQLVRAEVEKRGISWAEFQSKEELEAEAEAGTSASSSADQRLTNGVHGHGASAVGEDEEETPPRTSTAWTDGTFQTGVIGSDGQLRMNVVAGGGGGGGARTGGSLSDEELRRRMEEQMRGLGGEDDEDDEGGLHL
ncbi:hypothetical protein B0T19DRAFT_26742 [Cercophora scortea]|uniref:Secondary alcohol dehydrogenase n=1 Tax=Cercophora scortea TaxID=314031 RepID=A0AAE0MKP5_9PEZI|nr:hypothetical protein B0T19DRAFT_26742 [Cercophora scortea]